jgi:ABC-type antimicrobial peptide transport system permease subunit
LRQGLDILIGFSILILVIVIGIGYIASFLLLQGRKEEIAIMRSLGLSNKVCFLMMMMENFLLAITGIAIGSLAAFFSLSTETGMIVIGIVLALGCYMAGTCAALMKIGKISVMDALTRLD